ncbi:CLL_collapsed_G0029210.mRNA.1.CDS.1 [Saccharomyces cerevisiae]|nr:CLL_collapsed_G0029210.mRNA.1.CDS.1 [Saccharomyces cerevisiae]
MLNRPWGCSRYCLGMLALVLLALSLASNSDAVLSALKNLASVWGKTTDSTITLTPSESTSQSLNQLRLLLHHHRLKPLLLAQHRLRIVTCQILPLLCWLNHRRLCTRILALSWSDLL